jgi:hypothetical protein
MEKTERKKRTISEIRASKKTGEKMVYMSVPDYTSAQWAEKAGVDVAVVGDSLAMVAHGHANTIPATMDMMVMHSPFRTPVALCSGSKPSRRKSPPSFRSSLRFRRSGLARGRFSVVFRY